MVNFGSAARGPLLFGDLVLPVLRYCQFCGTARFGTASSDKRMTASSAVTLNSEFHKCTCKN